MARLFRSDRPPAADMTYTRAEAGRILLTASSHRGLQDDDRGYLVRLVTARTGLAQPEAERRGPRQQEDRSSRAFVARRVNSCA
jgi:hypothetical protein